MDQVAVNTEDLEVGAPLPWPLYAEGGTLLLSAGQAIASERQLEQLVAKGLFRPRLAVDEEDGEAAGAAQRRWTAAEMVVDWSARAWAVNEAVAGGDGAVQLDDLRGLASEVRETCWTHADAALGVLLVDEAAPYTRSHPVMCAIIAELVGSQLRLEPEVRESMICAALTANVGMFEIQEALTHQRRPPDEAQRAAIRAHPVAGRRLLEAAGVDDRLWLEVVASHHERPDGSGYPNGLDGETVSVPARVVALADLYTAMVLPRKYRDGVHAQNAMRKLFNERGKAVDAALAERFIKILGVYPPGALVRLANGERAVVVRRGARVASRPVVMSLLSPRGGPLNPPRRRDTAERDAYKVHSALPRDPALVVDPRMLWGYLERRPQAAD